jgi:aldehyde dehydrogenase (NAD+)
VTDFQAAEDSYIMKNESFGPIGQVNSFSTEEEVIAKANDTEYGLYASVFTNDISRAMRFAKEFESGTVVVNGAAPTVVLNMPFGGWKQSGVGCENGPQGFDHWSQIKTVYVTMD